MNVGLLIFLDNPKIEFEIALRQAADHYADRFGRRPTLCHVHPETTGLVDVDGIRVRQDRTVARRHLFLGVGQ